MHAVEIHIKQFLSAMYCSSLCALNWINNSCGPTIIRLPKPMYFVTLQWWRCWTRFCIVIFYSLCRLDFISWITTLVYLAMTHNWSTRQWVTIGQSSNESWMLTYNRCLVLSIKSNDVMIHKYWLVALNILKIFWDVMSERTLIKIYEIKNLQSHK